MGLILGQSLSEPHKPTAIYGNPSSILGLDTMLTIGVKRVVLRSRLVVQFYSDAVKGKLL